jgi:hypothetical protein
MDLQLLAAPVLLAADDLIHVLVILHALAERRVQQNPKDSCKHERRDADFCGFVAHR